MSWYEQFTEQLSRGWAFASSGRTLAIIFGVGFALLAVFLLIVSRTKWGQAKPLTKAVVLSVLAHVWLLMYALGTREVLPQGSSSGREQKMSMAFQAVAPAPLIDDAQPETEDGQSPEPAADPAQAWTQPVPLADLPKPPDLSQLFEPASAAPDSHPSRAPTPMPALPPLEPVVDSTQPQRSSDLGESFDSRAELAQEFPAEEPLESTVFPPPLPNASQDSRRSERAVDPLAVDSSMRMISAEHSPVLPPEAQLPDKSNVPREYQLRQAANRLQFAQAYGADADSELAVEAGLAWLAAAQSDGGGWEAARYGAGTETRALGEYRHGTGDRADTGISGLALLAFLAAGHTHVEGKYRPVVNQGLQYLLRAQMPSGDLSGPKQVGNEPSIVNARMYCHSIATLALAEAYAMTHDAFLHDALVRAAQYSINAQDVRGGGWRYRPRDPGDLSQFGWQAMALRSVERSGIEIPVEVQRRMRRFLDSCAAGNHGGLARYRPAEGRPSETMTAEALACRLLLEYPLTAEAQHEAEALILAHRPATAQDNVYFWYYATLALFQLQNDNWRTWNQALKARLLASQVPGYRDQAGSWDPDPTWGGYGGRVYSTAMSCLCLEVYYRYLPMYQRANLAGQPPPDSFRR